MSDQLQHYHTVMGFNFVIINAFVHTFMYFYYFLSEIGEPQDPLRHRLLVPDTLPGLRPPEFVALFITIIQISQMVFGIFVVAVNSYLWYIAGSP